MLFRACADASVGQSGDFNRASSSADDGAQTWTIACGGGWLYGIGGCIGPFFGTGVGLTFPGGVLAGAGAYTTAAEVLLLARLLRPQLAVKRRQRLRSSCSRWPGQVRAPRRRPR